MNIGIVNEEWKSIDGFIKYQVSNIGRVRNANTGRFLKPSVNERGYNAVTLRVDNQKSTGMIHRLVAQEFLEKGNGYQVDHINHNKLDNCVSNLRWVSNQQNAMNRSKSSSNASSKYKGVCFNNQQNKWLASIKIHNISKYIGNFVNEKDAARAYNNKALELFEEYASINEISDAE